MLSLVFLFSISMLFLTHGDAMVCSIGREPDPSADNRYRWVIPVEDPCRCTEIRPGGVNTCTPDRNFKVVYFYISTSTAHEVHKWLNCSSGRTGSKGESSPLASEGTPSTSGPHPTTKEALLEIEGTACSWEGSYSAYPYDCAVFYVCEFEVWVKRVCGTGTLFNNNFNVCDHSVKVPCPRV